MQKNTRNLHTSTNSGVIITRFIVACTNGPGQAETFSWYVHLHFCVVNDHRKKILEGSSAKKKVTSLARTLDTNIFPETRMHQNDELRCAIGCDLIERNNGGGA